MSENKPAPQTNVPSKGSQSLSKGLRQNSGPTVLENDLGSLESNLEAQDLQMSGAAVIFSPNDVLIERIPFSTEEHIRGYLR